MGREPHSSPFTYRRSGAARTLKVKLRDGHISVTLFGKRRDSDNIPMRQAEFEVYKGNRMFLGSFTASHVKHPESSREELRT